MFTQIEVALHLEIEHVYTMCCSSRDVHAVAFWNNVCNPAGMIPSSRVIRPQGHVDRATVLGPCTAGACQLHPQILTLSSGGMARHGRGVVLMTNSDAALPQ